MHRVSELKDRHSGAVALLIGGGPSGRHWETVHNLIRPDIIIGVNGVVTVLGARLDYHVVMEKHAYLVPWFKDERAKHRLIFRWMFARKQARYTDSVYLVDRLLGPPTYGIHIGEIPGTSGLEYGFLHNHDEYTDVRNPIQDVGLMCGLVCTAKGQPDGVRRWRDCGTSMFQALHVAGILGCTEVHTIGLDLFFPAGDTHWYPDRNYDSKSDISDLTGTANWHTSMYVNKYGVNTTWWWLESAAVWELMKPIWDKQDLKWVDHSGGLLQLRKTECTSTTRV